MVVQVIPDPGRQVCGGADDALLQDGCHHDSITHHPLLVDEGGRVVFGEAEEERAHDAAAEGVRVVEGAVVVGQHSQPPGEDLLCQAPDGRPPARDNLHFLVHCMSPWP